MLCRKQSKETMMMGSADETPFKNSPVGGKTCREVGGVAGRWEQQCRGPEAGIRECS